MSVSHHVENGETTINIASERTSIHVNGRDAGVNRRYAEPPPPYTYTNAGLYSSADETIERDPDAPPAYDSNDRPARETPVAVTITQTGNDISVSSATCGNDATVSSDQSVPANSNSTDKPINAVTASSNNAENASSSTA